MAEANGWKIWLEVHHTGWVPNWYSAGLICPLTALPDTPEIKLNTQMKASFHMNCHRVISKDVNSQIPIFPFSHTKENWLNKLEGIFYSMQQIKGLGQINENERQVFTLKHRDGAVVNTVICFKQYTIFFSAKPASKLLIAGGSLHSSLCCFASSYL